ncbi:MAG: FHA domain-containing protein [Flavobacteriales bacterium]
MTLGRDPECEVTLNFPMVSWRHARLILGIRICYWSSCLKY